MAPTLACCLVPVALLFVGCATAKPAKVAFDISKVHRIAVLPFEGTGGKAVTDEFVRQLLGRGYEVLASTAGADAVLTGQVAYYQPGRKLVVFLGQAKTIAGADTMTEDNPILSVTGASAATQGTVAVPDAQVVSVGASVDVSGRMYALGGGLPVWLDDYSYEALEIPNAVRVVADVLIKSMQRGGPARPGRTL